jgi:hypothetical protein
MKFLHVIAEDWLYLMQKKWNSNVNLEPDNTIGNFEVRITTIIVTTRPLQFTHCAEISFCGSACEIQLSLLFPVIQFWAIHFKTLPYTKSVTFSGVNYGAFFTIFQVWCLLLSDHTQCKHWDFPSSLACDTGILSVSLLVWPLTQISVLD